MQVDADGAIERTPVLRIPLVVASAAAGELE